MIEYLKAISFIRRQTNINTNKWLTVNLVGFIVLSAIALLVDKFLGWGFGWNTIRAVVSTALTIPVFCITYSLWFLIWQKHMKAGVFYETGRVGVEELSMSTAGKTDVVVQVLRAGICGADRGLMRQPISKKPDRISANDGLILIRLSVIIFR